MDDKNFEAKLGDYGIYRYLDISTGHITKGDADLLKAGHEPDGAYLIGKYDEGFVLSLGEPVEAMNNTVNLEFSEAFRNILRYATNAGCMLMRLDADGMEFPDFPTFDW